MLKGWFGMGGKHLTWNERLQIEALVKAKLRPREIAEVIGCTVRTIYRELQRGACDLLDGTTYKTYRSYSAQISQNRADLLAERRKGRPLKLTEAADLVAFLEDYIGTRHYSPAATVQELKALPLPQISTTSVYRYIYRGLLRLCSLDLPVGRYKPRHRQPPKYTSKRHRSDRSIDDRPAEVAARTTFGHWEMDTVVGKAKGPSRCALVLTERKTDHELIFALESKSAQAVVDRLDALKTQLGENFGKVFKSITCDNGTEFSAAQAMERYAPIYYCHPYHSWERGLNENQNKLIRRFLPKGKSMAHLTDAQAEYISLWMNHYPRKSLGWQRPADLFAAECATLGIQFPA